MIKGKVLSKALDENGNIKVEMEYTLTDGSKKIGHTRYAFWNYTPEKVVADIKAHCEVLMKKAYALKRHSELILSVPVIGIEYTCEEFEMVIKPEIKNEAGDIIQEKETIIINDK